jgi:hypothetical protein
MCVCVCMCGSLMRGSSYHLPPYPRTVLYARAARREYWQLFNDFSGRKDGLMTTLPMELFSLFEFESGRAFALEVFVALLMFCSGDWDGKATVLFSMFDMSKRNALQAVRDWLPADAPSRLLKCACRACTLVCGTVCVCARVSVSVGLCSLLACAVAGLWVLFKLIMCPDKALQLRLSINMGRAVPVPCVCLYAVGHGAAAAHRSQRDEENGVGGRAALGRARGEDRRRHVRPFGVAASAPPPSTPPPSTPPSPPRSQPRVRRQQRTLHDGCCAAPACRRGCACGMSTRHMCACMVRYHSFVCIVLCVRCACAVRALCVRCACAVRALCVRCACAVRALCVRCACAVRALCEHTCVLVLGWGACGMCRFLMADADRDNRVVLPEFQAWVAKNARWEA